MAEKLQVGDRVRLKSGGPVMTVEDPSKYNGYDWTVSVAWFNTPTPTEGYQGFVQRDQFKADVLDLIQPAETAGA